MRKLTTSFTDLSVLNREKQKLSVKTKQHLQNYNEQMLKKRTSQLAAAPEKTRAANGGPAEDALDRVSESVELQNSASLSLQQSKEDSESGASKFNISQR